MTNYERVLVGSMTNKLGLNWAKLSSNVYRTLLKFSVDLVSLDFGLIELVDWIQFCRVE